MAKTINRRAFYKMDKETRYDEIDDIQLIVKRGSDKELQDFLRVVHPADIADLVEQVDDVGRRRIFSLIPDHIGADVLPEIEEHVFDEVIESVSDDRMVEFVEEMETDDAADILAELPKEDQRRILARIDKSDSEEIQLLMDYDEETAGGLMQTELIAVQNDATVEETIEEIRKQKDETDNFHYVFVVDENNRLEGVLDIRDLLLSPADQKVSGIMDPEVIATKVDTDQEEVSSMFLKYNLISLPVVDNQNRLIGRIWFDDIMDVMEDEADEDFLLMAGAGEEELEEFSVVKGVQARLPWLAITWVGGIGTALIMGHFTSTMENLVLLAAFIPIVMAMGGNVGTQAATIVVRGIATGKIDYKGISSFFVAQIAIGIVLGIIIGAATAGFVQFHYSVLELSIVIGVAMVSVMGFAALLGTALPSFFHRIGVDPAIATAPIIATACDIVGIFIYLSLANLLLSM